MPGKCVGGAEALDVIGRVAAVAGAGRRTLGAVFLSRAWLFACRCGGWLRGEAKVVYGRTDEGDCFALPVAIDSDVSGVSISHWGWPVTDYAGMVASGGAHGCWREAVEILHEEYGGRSVRCCFDALLLEDAHSLSEAARAAGGSAVQMTRSDVSPRIALRSFGRRSASAVKISRLRRCGSLELELRAPLTEVSRHDPLFNEWHRCRWNSCPDSADFFSARDQRFFSAALRGDNIDPPALEYSVLTLNGTPISYLCFLWADSEVGLYRGSFDPEWSCFSPGTVHLRLVADALRSRGWEYLDLLRGDYAYKWRTATEARPVYQVTWRVE